MKKEKPLESARRPACGNVDKASALDHSPTGEQKQKKRTFDVLPNPAKLISYRQAASGRAADRKGSGRPPRNSLHASLQRLSKMASRWLF